MSKPKKALIVTALLVIITIAIFSHVLRDISTVDTYTRPLLQRSDNGKLVARSQLNYHHVVEQWVPPEHQGQRTRLKERLIEDGRMIKEDIEYPESENEVKDEPVQHLSNFSLPLIGNENKHGKEHEKSTPHQSVIATAKRKEDELQQPPAEGNEERGLVEHKGSSNPNVTSSHSKISTEERDDIIDSQKSSVDFQIEPKLVGEQSLGEIDSRVRTKIGSHTNSSSSSSENVSNKIGRVAVAKKPISTAKRKDQESWQPPAEGNEKGGLSHKGSSDPNLTSLSSRENVIGNYKSELKTPVDEQSLVEMDSRVKAETGIHSKPSSSSHWKLSNRTGHKIVAKTPDGELGKEREVHSAERRAVFDPAKEQAAGFENGGKESHPSGFVRVVSLNSRGEQTVRYVQLSDDQKGRVINSQDFEHKTHEFPVQYGEKTQLTVSQVDVDSDPRYAHLPPSVRKKIALLRKERQKRLARAKLIREKCEGNKYCLHVQYKERFLHNNCFYDALRQEKWGVQLKPCMCRMFHSQTNYLNGRRVEANDTRPRVALVSLPGSGNTWVRGLLELATGYCTGSMWCDPTLRAMQFCAEGLRSNVLVVKNHDPTIRWRHEICPENATDMSKPVFGSAIFVHRNPYEANIAEWNRALGAKVYNATKHNRTVAGIGYYDDSNLKDQHTVTFGKEAFGESLKEWCISYSLSILKALCVHTM